MLKKISFHPVTRTISVRSHIHKGVFRKKGKHHNDNNSNFRTNSILPATSKLFHPNSNNLIFNRNRILIPTLYNELFFNTTKSLSTSSKRSPYTIMKIRTSATLENIKTSFRKLAKQYHPDLNPDRPIHESEQLMRELIEAYDQLMYDYNGGRKVGDSRVALACEMYTIDELKMDTVHDVYTLRMIYEDQKDITKKNNSTFQLNPDVIINIPAHPDDSISDLKRYIQKHYGKEWGLIVEKDDIGQTDTLKTTRRLDRDGLATGWELVSITRNDNSTDDCTILGSWFFLHSYNIHHHDIIHAIVRRYV